MSIRAAQTTGLAETALPMVEYLAKNYIPRGEQTGKYSEAQPKDNIVGIHSSTMQRIFTIAREDLLHMKRIPSLGQQVQEVAENMQSFPWDQHGW